MSKGRPAKPDRVGHRKAPGEGTAIEVLPVDQSLVSIEPPANLPPAAAEVWRICTGDMAVLGHLREPDLILLQGYAQTFFIMCNAWASIEKHGSMLEEPVVVYDPIEDCERVAGYRVKPNPAVKQHDAAVNRLRLLSSELALNPRARIQFNLLQVATSSIALSVVESLEKKLDALDAKEAAALAQAAAAKKPVKKAVKKPVKDAAKKKAKGK